MEVIGSTHVQLVVRRIFHSTEKFRLQISIQQAEIHKIGDKTNRQ